MPATKERERLREAIEAQNFAQRALDEAKRAAHHAQAKWSAANSTVGALTREIEEAEDAPASSDRLIADLAAGGVDVLIETNPVTELRKALDAAECESAVWNAARRASEEAIESRERALDLARHRVVEAAQHVADVEIDVTAMLARAETARLAVLSMSAELMAAMKMLPQSSMSRHEIADFLQMPWCAPIAIERAQSTNGETLREGFAALCADASAKLN